MRVRAVFYVAAALVVGVLVLANWTLLATPVELSFIAARVQAPLIILVLLIVAVVSLLDVVVHMQSHHAWTRERRALKNELDAARVRADSEEESRIGTLRVTMERELANIHAQLDRLSEGQSALLSMGSTERPAIGRPTEAPRRFEPELIPPRVDAG